MVLALVLTLAVFALDSVTGPGVDADVLYVVPLLVCSFAGPPRLVIYGAWIASMLAVLGLLQQPFATLPIAAVWNRLIALAVIWTTAAIVFRLRETSISLEARTRDLADMSYALDQSAIVAITNTKGTITFVNDKFCQISKYPRHELLGRDHRILNSGYHPKEFMRKLWHTIESGKIWRGEIRNRAKDGTLYWVDTTIVPFLDDDGHPYQYMAIRYEITDRKRSEDLLREQEALARLGQMAAVVAHEVKNPIAGIRGALQVIVARMAAEQRDRAIIGDIIARLDALNLIVQDLLLFARPRNPRHEKVDLRGLLDSTIDLLRRDPAFAGVTVAIDGNAGAISADPELLRIVFQNVLLNAAQAMSGHGVIDIALTAADASAQVAVRDHGPGMPVDVREKAFDAFFTTKHRGTGLGLPIARRVVESHGGRIAIDVPEGGGTRLVIELTDCRHPPYRVRVFLRGSRGTRRAPRAGMREHYEPPSKYTWIVYAFAMVLVGVLAGYILALQGPGNASGARAASAAAAPATPVVDESELRAYRDILARDPKNVQAAIKAGNLLYDGQRYAEAIAFYQQAFALSSSDINVSTDLGTALWYSGRVDEALTQYAKSLAIDRGHAQTLFNLGIVRADGKHDYRGAIEAWETLLTANPTYPQAERVRLMIADARKNLGA